MQFSWRNREIIKTFHMTGWGLGAAKRPHFFCSPPPTPMRCESIFGRPPNQMPICLRHRFEFDDVHVLFAAPRIAFHPVRALTLMTHTRPSLCYTFSAALVRQPAICANTGDIRARALRANIICNMCTCVCVCLCAMRRWRPHAHADIRADITVRVCERMCLCISTRFGARQK